MVANDPRLGDCQSEKALTTRVIIERVTMQKDGGNVEGRKLRWVYLREDPRTRKKKKKVPRTI